MADDVTVDNGGLTDYDVATDDDGSGNHVQIVKLAQSADGSRTAITADSGGLLVNLGANNDVTVTSGTVTLGAGSAAVGKLAANSGVDIGDVDVTSVTPGTAAGNLGKAEDAAHASGDTGVAMLAVRRDTAAAGSDTDGDYSTLNVDSTGRLHVNVGNTVTVGSHAVTNGGTFATQVDGAALTALQLIDDTVFSDDAAFTVGSSKVNAIGAMADESSTDSVDEGDVGIPRMTLDRKLRTTQTPHTSGGLDVFRTLDADETEEDVKTSAGMLYGWHIYNDGAAEVYVKFYNLTAANTTVGSSTPRMTVPIPAGSAANVEFTNGIVFDTAICIAATTGVGDADTTAPAANQVVANVLYK